MDDQRKAIIRESIRESLRPHNRAKYGNNLLHCMIVVAQMSGPDFRVEEVQEVILDLLPKALSFFDS